MKNKTIAYIGLGSWLLAFLGSIFGGRLSYPISLIAGVGTIFFIIMAVKRLWGNNRNISLALIISVALFLVISILANMMNISQTLFLIVMVIYVFSLFSAMAKLFKLKDEEVFKEKK